jgi:hypothetical protein
MLCPLLRFGRDVVSVVGLSFGRQHVCEAFLLVACSSLAPSLY